MDNKDQIQGKLEQAEGNIKENVGDVIGNEKMEYEGKIDKAKGEVREGYGDVKEGVENTVEDWKR